MSKSQTAADQLKQIANGDRASMKAFYEAHSDAIYKFIRTRLADEFEAADLMHETMLDVWRSAAKFEGRSSVRTWVFSIARNKIVDRLRKKEKNVLADPDVAIPDESPDPLAVTAAAQDAVRVRECISKLSAAHRSAIHLAFFEDLSYGEIAIAEGCPVGTIKTRIHHAKKLLMRCLTDSR